MVDDLERNTQLEGQDSHIHRLFEAIRQLMEAPKNKRRIGFHALAKRDANVLVPIFSAKEL